MIQIHVQICGAILVILAFCHIVFPRYFDWKKELSSLSMINRQMMTVHTFFIALVVLLMGILCLSSAPDLINTPFGKRIALGLGVFWFARLLIQFFGYSSVLWKGKRFETFMHILFTIFWIYLSVVFLIIYFQ